MKLPAKIEYAYKAVLELSLRYRGDNPIQIHVISTAQKIPRKFLTQLLLRLKNAGIVYSLRGASGGYVLARPPARITLADVFSAIDGNMLDMFEEAKVTKTTDSGKLLRVLWNDINKEISKRLKNITFEQLISRVQGQQITYQI
ncbi:MAG: Rrf2 family transcriptional regulator [Candidatus Omnitrophota bacterium]|nr:Rrf2 family transcriptional regulator [Candidatus Omnitrophota bacterium]